jgi:secreted trypsin-like serine protease
MAPDTGTGVRRVADMQGFDNLRKTLFQTSQNPALGNDGTCYGDSGGPAFYVTTNGPVQVGITSSGDAVCRATGTYARMDTETARTFIDCVREHPDDVKACGF